MSTLRTLLGDNADEKINNAMNILKSNGLIDGVQATPQNTNSVSGTQGVIKSDAPQENQNNSSPMGGNGSNMKKNQSGGGLNGLFGNTQNVLTPEGIEFISQLRGMVDKMSTANDNRSNLLQSLRPFMRGPRQQTIDRAIRIMNIGRFSGLFGSGLFGKQ